MLNFHYSNRLIRRVAWGVGAIAVTDERIIGIVIREEVPGIDKSTRERFTMPLMSADPEFGTVLVFESTLANFNDIRTSNIRAPLVALEGNCCLMLGCSDVLGKADRMVRPRKTQIRDMFTWFVGT